MKATEKTKMAKSWLGWLDDQKVRLIILDSQDDRDMIKTLRSQPGWDIDTDDEELVIFTRTGESSGFYL